MAADTIPPDTPIVARLQLAFVPYGTGSAMLWWPAITYSSFTQAMETRQAFLSPATKDMLAIKIIDEHYSNLSTGHRASTCIAQLLGFQEKWLEFSRSQSIHCYLPYAVAQKLPTKFQMTFNMALLQVKQLLGCDTTNAVYVDGVLRNTKFNLPSRQSENTNCLSNLISSSEKRIESDPSRTWGRDKPIHPKNLFIHPAEQALARKDFQLKKRKIPIGAQSNRSTSSKRSRADSVETTKCKKEQRRVPSSQKSKRSREDFYVFKNLWSFLKHDGWTAIRARDPLHTWYYVRPGVDVKTGNLGVDYYASPDDVIDWARKVNYRGQVGILTSDESSVGEEDEPSRVSATDADESLAGETLGSTEEEDSRQGDEDVSHSSFCNSPLPNRSFPKVWKYLKQKGWDMLEARKYHPRSDATWYYCRPGISDVRTAKCGQDFFSTPAEVMDWVEANPRLIEDCTDSLQVAEGNNPSKFTGTRDPALLPPDSDCSSSVYDDDSSRFDWRNLWPRLQRFGWTFVKATRYNKLHDFYYLRPGKSITPEGLGSDYFLSANDVIEEERRREEVEDRRLLHHRSHIDDKAMSLSKPRKLRRITLSPTKSIEKECIRSNAKPSAKKIRERNLEIKGPVIKTEWWHKEPLPSFNQVWRILEEKLHLRYFNGKYRLPKNVLFEGQRSWSNDQDMRKFLCQFGIPNFDPNLLTSEEVTTLTRWTTFANVPVTTSNSVKSLERNPIPTCPMESLTLLGVAESDAGRFLWKNETFETLERLRVHIRGLPELFSGGRRQVRCSPLNDEQLLELRLWAALSSEPLPVFEGKGEDKQHIGSTVESDV